MNVFTMSGRTVCRGGEALPDCPVSQLSRSTPLKRTGRLNAYSARRRKRDATYADARRYVYDRSRGMCEAPVHADDCPGECQQTHHIAGRGGDDPHRVENLIGLSAACHARAHADKRWAMRWGISTSRLAIDDGGAA